MVEKKLLVVLEGAIMAGLAAVLSAVVPSVEWFDISLGIIPILFFSLRRGMSAGILAGVLWGILPIIFGRAQILTVVQGILEYPIANACVGFAGIYSKKIKQQLVNKKWSVFLKDLVLASFVGVGLKYFCHFIAGIIYWGSYAPKSMGPILYSLVVNGSSFIFNFVLATIVIYLVGRKNDKLFLTQK